VVSSLCGRSTCQLQCLEEIDGELLQQIKQRALHGLTVPAAAPASSWGFFLAWGGGGGRRRLGVRTLKQAGGGSEGGHEGASELVEGSC